MFAFFREIVAFLLSRKFRIFYDKKKQNFLHFSQANEMRKMQNFGDIYFTRNDFPFSLEFYIGPGWKLLLTQAKIIPGVLTNFCIG